MAQNYRRTIMGIGAPACLTPPTSDGTIDGPDRRQLAGMYRGRAGENLRRNFSGLPGFVLSPVPDGNIAQQSPDGSDIRHLAGVWRAVANLIMPWHLFFGRSA